jgi:hypothetical protein
MVLGMETRNLATRYGLPALEWETIRRDLDAGAIETSGGARPNTCWLTTVDDDGAPHTNGIGTVWHDEAFWFATGRTTRKGHNLARDSRCSLSVSVPDFDLVVEGMAEAIEEQDGRGTGTAMARRGMAVRSRRFRYRPDRRI